MKILFVFLISAAFATEKLRVYDDTRPGTAIYASSEFQEIVPVLNEIGVRFEKWETSKVLPAGATETDVFEAYHDDIERLKEEYPTVDIVRMLPNSTKKVELRNKFLNEHTHTEDEVRLFVEGSGLFYLHAAGKVYVVLCEKGELISIPANTTHWFDMGKAPFFTAIRFFNNTSGWVPNFTSSGISKSFPQFEDAVKAILTDIEGTTTSISFVHQTLFPYAKQHVREFVAVHGNEEQVQKIVKEVEEIAGVGPEEVVPTLLTWMEQDKKITPLKSLQGMMWEEGYKEGVLKGHVYNDAFVEMKAWKERGIPLYVYSSGSVQAQKLIFGYSNQGDLTVLFSNYFDTKVGGKKESASYRKIADEIGVVPEQILFLSDSVDEVNAAREVGMQTVLLNRDGLIENSDHRCVKQFNEILVP